MNKDFGESASIEMLVVNIYKQMLEGKCSPNGSNKRITKKTFESNQKVGDWEVTDCDGWSLLRM
jgi:hypothetical protein